MSATPTDPTLIAAIITALGGLVSIAGWIAKRHIRLIDSMENRIEADRKERIEQLTKEKGEAEARATKEAERWRHEAEEARTRAEFQTALIAAQREQIAELARINVTLQRMQIGHERLTTALELETDRIDVLMAALENVVGEDVMDRARSRTKRQSMPTTIMTDVVESPPLPPAPPPLRRRAESAPGGWMQDSAARR